MPPSRPRLPSAVDSDYPSLDALCSLREQMGAERWRAVSDVAQVVACYLVCHPRVDAVRYAGLKSDPLFAEAAQTLQGGFGPCVRYCVAGAWRELACEAQDPRDVVMELERALSAS